MTAHSPRRSSLGFPWHQSLCHPRLRSRESRGCPRPHPRIVPAGSSREQRLKTLWGGGIPNLARNATAVGVGDTFIMQNYPVLLRKITVCGVSERGAEGSAGSSITRGSIPLITLIRSPPSPRRRGAAAGLSGCQVPLRGLGAVSIPLIPKGPWRSPLGSKKDPDAANGIGERGEEGLAQHLCRVPDGHPKPPGEIPVLLPPQLIAFNRLIKGN